MNGSDEVPSHSRSESSAGAVYVFVRTGTTWARQAYLKASNTDTGDHFGYSVALSSRRVLCSARDRGRAERVTCLWI